MFLKWLCFQIWIWFDFFFSVSENGRTFAAPKNTNAMKVKLTKSQIEMLAKNPETHVEVNDPWWVIVLKVVAYLIGLLLAGVGTAEAATFMMPLV